MAPLPKPTVWWIGLASYWVASLPAHAYPAINGRDQELRVSGAGWWCVTVLDHDWQRKPDFDLAGCIYLADFGLDRASLMAESARSDAEHHPIREMRALYQRCALFLDAEVRRLRGAG